MSRRIELKPCPWCKGKAVIHKSKFGVIAPYFVECYNGCISCNLKFKTERECAEWWNSYAVSSEKKV